MANDGCCVYCGARSEVMDHAIPLARGGLDHFSNLVPACTACNESKNDRLFPSWISTVGFSSGDASEAPRDAMFFRVAHEVNHAASIQAIERIERASAEIADPIRRRWFVSRTWIGYPPSRSFVERWRTDLLGLDYEEARAAGYPPRRFTRLIDLI
ncbi:HNH endonuclease [Kitasatospora purpeofusca]|nr:HNH endonuclease signature motif containing protein [Kitasatospora sp. MBT66]